MNTDGTQNIIADDRALAEDGALTRRQVLTTAARTAGAGLLLLLPMARESALADTPPGAAAPDTASWTVIGKAEQFIKGQPLRTALANGDVLYVTRLTADTLSVVSAKCTHRGCEVGYDKAAGQLVCPCHGAAFATSGKNIHGTSRRPDEALPALPSVPVVQKEGQVLADLKSVPAPSLIPGH